MIGLFGVACGLAWTCPALAQDVRDHSSSWTLRWTQLDDCPEGTLVEEQIRQRLARYDLYLPDEFIALAEVSLQGQQYHLELTTNTGFERSFDSPSCHTLARATVLVVTSLATPADQIVNPPQEAIPPEPLIERNTESLLLPSERETLFDAIWFGAGIGVDIQTALSPGLVGFVQSRLHLSRWRFGARLSYTQPWRSHGVSNSQAGLRFRWVSSAFTIGIGQTWGPVDLSVHGGLGITWLQSWIQGAFVDRQDSVWLPDLRVGAKLGVALSSRWRLILGMDVIGYMRRWSADAEDRGQIAESADITFLPAISFNWRWK